MTCLLAGRGAIARAKRLEEWLTTPWRLLTWSTSDGPERFRAMLPEIDAIVADSRVPLPVPAAPRLRLLQIPFTGYDWIAPAQLPQGVVFCNTYEHETTIAEHVLAAMLLWQTGIAATDAAFRRDSWKNYGRGPGEGPQHKELRGATLGIVGYGHIGREVATRAAAFAMRVVAVSRSERPAEPPLAWRGTMDALDRLLGESDFVLVACPLSEETRGLFDAGRLAAMKPTGVIINVARGAVIDEAALYTALAAKTIGGAIVDTWYVYPTADDPAPRPSRFPFHKLDNLIMTPHNSAWTAEMFERRWRFVASNLDRLARGEPVENVCFAGTA